VLGSILLATASHCTGSVVYGKFCRKDGKAAKLQRKKKKALTGCRVATALFNKEKFITARRNTRSRNKSPENWMFLIENTGKTCGKG
jgi:hypothetical protein